MDIHEYLALMGVTFGGTTEQKLKGTHQFSTPLFKVALNIFFANNILEFDNDIHFLKLCFVASFEIFDKNGDGVLSRDEVRSMLVMVVKQVSGFNSFFIFHSFIHSFIKFIYSFIQTLDYIQEFNSLLFLFLIRFCDEFVFSGHSCSIESKRGQNGHWTDSR
jgi:hypothetical protein